MGDPAYYYGAPGTFGPASRPQQPHPQPQPHKPWSDTEPHAASAATTSQEQPEQPEQPWADTVASRFAALSTSTSSTTDSTPICHYFLQGNCRHGATCRFRHARPEPTRPKVEVKKQSAGAVGAGRPLAERVGMFRRRIRDLAASLEHECGICLSRVRPTSRFGVLPSCPHAFCLGCIREWRGTGVTVAQRVCPQCRVHSHYVVPSDYLPLDAEDREEIAREYRAELACIPCKHFDEGRGICPFGTSCFFAHLGPDGKPLEHQSKVRLRADGQLESVKEVTLAEFFEQGDFS